MCFARDERKRRERGGERRERQRRDRARERDTERSMVRQSQSSRDVFTALISAANIEHFPKDQQIMGFKK